MGLPISWLAARIARKPLVVAVHADLDAALKEWMPSRVHPLFYWIHRRVDRAICVSPDLIDPLARNGLPLERIRVVRNGIDVEAVQAAAEMPVESADLGMPVVVATGRISWAKAHDVLLKAHAQVVRTVPHRLSIYNDGPDLASMQALAQNLGVTGSVEFMHARPNVLPYVKQASVFCLPSRSEGSPLALLEAISLGVPCIAADCSEGVRVALDHGRVGDLVPVGDVEALAERLQAHLTNPEPLRAKAAQGPAHARSFDASGMAERWSMASLN